jgi:hypothetical protein
MVCSAEKNESNSTLQGLAKKARPRSHLPHQSEPAPVYASLLNSGVPFGSCNRSISITNAHTSPSTNQSEPADRNSTPAVRKQTSRDLSVTKSLLNQIRIAELSDPYRPRPSQTGPVPCLLCQIDCANQSEPADRDSTPASASRQP